MGLNPLTKEWFKKKIGIAVNQAGARYTPRANVTLPINRLFFALGRTDEAFLEFEKLYKELLDKCYKTSLKKNYEKFSLPQGLLNDLFQEIQAMEFLFKSINKANFELVDFEKLANNSQKAQKSLYLIIDVVRKESAKKATEEQQKPGERSDYDSLRYLISEFQKLQELIGEINNISESSFAKLFNNPFLLLLGPAGIGKTHVLCDIAEQRIKNNLPTILILGQQLQLIKDPLEAIIGELGLTYSKNQFLKHLNTIAKRRKKRVLILIDAINEGDRRGWKRTFKNFLGEISKYSSIGVAVSCRTPFEKITIPSKTRLLIEHHRGFAEHELEALKIYCNKYKLHLPEIPVLAHEFSNPLFLKLFCESLENAVVRKRHKQINDIASGQRGMTNIIEDIVIDKGRKLAKQFGCTSNVVWRIFKEDIASQMADKKCGWLPLSDVMKIIGKEISLKGQSKNFLRAMINESIVAEDVYYDSKTQKPYEVIRFQYQKFSDHIIARHLLNRYFDNKKLKESFEQDSYLGQLFRDENAVRENAGIIEALIIEFPSRIGNKGELFQNIPGKISGDLIELFINGLYWRDANCFNDVTNKIINNILGIDDYRNLLIDVLVALSTKPKHPYNATRLDKYLENFTMPQRDLNWSEFLRKQTENSSVYKILNWVESSDLKEVGDEYIQMYIIVLCWFLTSTNGSLRDRATKGLYSLGRRCPQHLFEKTLNALKINDPYIIERMLAASYGVVMAMNYLATTEFKQQLKFFGMELFKLMFAKDAKFSTTHILTRDYAKHIIDIALLHDSKLISQDDKRYIQAPFQCGGIRKWGKSKELNEGEYRNGSAPMHMDFANYTLGSIIKNRHNYDFDNKEYKTVKANILWRIYKLGYSHELFKDIDSRINEQHWGRSNRANVERYGKKYSWIAFYELTGFRRDNDLLPYGYMARFSADIDPSFPISPKNENVVKADYIRDRVTRVEDWIEHGPIPNVKTYLEKKRIGKNYSHWVLLDGFIEQDDFDSSRGIFIIVKSFLVANELRDNLLEAVSRWGKQNHYDVPSVVSLNYTFSGEIPWCETFGFAHEETQIRVPTGNKIKIQQPIGKQVIIKRASSKKVITMPFYSKEDLKRGYTEFERTETVDFDTEVPVCNYTWSDAIGHDGLNVSVPIQTICNKLNLTSRPQDFDIYDEKGKVAFIARKWGKQPYTHQGLAYLRKDLLNKYLKDENLSLIWIINGERRFMSKDNNELDTFSKSHSSYKQFKDIVLYK